MATPGSAHTCDGRYSKLIDDQGGYEEAGPAAPMASPIRLAPGPGGPGPYRLAIICLATMCAILLISIISISAHSQSSAPGGDGGGGAVVQRQEQGANVSALMDAVHKLQREKEQLQRDKDELLARLTATTAPEVARTRPAIVCPDDWHLFNGSCYFISRTTRDWPESKSFCESQGAYLAIIHTAEEQTFLWDLLPRGHWNSYWFGITDEHTEDEWKWVDGTPLLGGFWEDGEPNNHIDEDCGYIVKTRVLERVAVRSWYDAPCSMYLPFICEKDMGPGASTALPH